MQDVNPNYLEIKDYILAEKIYKKLDWRIPRSIKKRLPQPSKED